MEREIDKERQDIDEIDSQIRILLNERAKKAQKIGELKGSLPVYRPEREAQVLRKAMNENPGPLKKEMIFKIQREIMSACLSLEKPLTIGYEKDQPWSLLGALEQFGSFANVSEIYDPERGEKELVDKKIDYLFLHESSLFYLLGEEAFSAECFIQGVWKKTDHQESFFVIGKEKNPPSGEDRTLCWTSSETEAASLAQKVSVLRTVLLEENGIVLEMEGHWEQPEIQRWLEKEENRLLGSYPFFE